MIHTVLTIAGSDPSGGAGIQADLKTFCSFKVYGMAVIAALTAQNTLGVSACFPIPPTFVRQQLDSVFSDIPAGAVKTGMLGNAEVVEVVAESMQRYGVDRLIVDPVLTSTSGAALLDASGISILRDRLIPLTLLLTPNLAEAGILTGREVHDIPSMQDAARRLCDLGPRYVLIKGGHLEGDAADLLFDGKGFETFREPRITTNDLHGTGCVLSAAIAARLAIGDSVPAAVRQGKAFVTGAIRRSLRIGRGAGPVDAAGVGLPNPTNPPAREAPGNDQDDPDRAALP